MPHESVGRIPGDLGVDLWLVLVLELTGRVRSTPPVAVSVGARRPWSRAQVLGVAEGVARWVWFRTGVVPRDGSARDPGVHRLRVGVATGIVGAVDVVVAGVGRVTRCRGDRLLGAWRCRPVLARTWLPTTIAAIKDATMALVRPAARLVTRPS